MPQYNAEVIDRLEQAGLVIIGKTNMDEFAMGSTTETSAYGVTRNPWDLEHVQAAPPAVPVRQWQQERLTWHWVLIPEVPSVSQAPTAVLPESNRPMVQYPVTDWLPTHPLDQIGPVGKDVADCAALLEIIAGHDAKDSTSMKRGS